VTLRPATPADVPLLAQWDREPDVISATSDDPNAEKAFEGAYWPDELAMQSEGYRCLSDFRVSGCTVAAVDGRLRFLRESAMKSR
jgi:hypothetical protein